MEPLIINDLHEYEDLLSDNNSVQIQLNNYFNNKIVVKLVLHEFHGHFVNFLKKNDNEFLHVIMCGSFNFEFEKIKVFKNNFWLFYLKEFYKNKSYLLKQVNYTSTKPKYFDVLLGTMFTRENRIFIKNFLERNNLTDKVVLKYFSRNYNINLLEKQKTHTEFDIGVENFDINQLKDKDYTARYVEYEGEQIGISNIIPIDIYNQTAYSIVTESLYENTFNFFTEKSFKPILTKRLFVHFSGQHHLKNLKKIYGFKTFDGIIDESYDEIEDQNERWNKAAEQVLFLISQPQEKILQQIQPIVEYNFNHLMNNFPWIYEYY